MRDHRSRRYAQALERIYELDPSAGRAVEQYVADLRAECARRRVEAKTSKAAAP